MKKVKAKTANAIHRMCLQPQPFGMIESGQKTIELRLFDEKRQKIEVGDRIIFANAETEEELDMTVVNLYRFRNFDELYRALPLLNCGYTPETVCDASPRDMEKYYSAEEQEKFEVIGIELCRTE